MGDELGTNDVAKLLHVSRPRVWQLRKRPDFPAPSGTREGRDFWYATVILRWAAQASPQFAKQAPVLYRPAADSAAEFLGGEAVGGHVVHQWATGHGLICLEHPPREGGMRDHREVVDRLAPYATTIVKVRFDWDVRGPDLEALDVETGRQYDVGWDDLRRHLGEPAPWWPPSLRRAEQMVRW